MLLINVINYFTLYGDAGWWWQSVLCTLFNLPKFCLSHYIFFIHFSKLHNEIFFIVTHILDKGIYRQTNVIACTDTFSLSRHQPPTFLLFYYDGNEITTPDHRQHVARVSLRHSTWGIHRRICLDHAIMALSKYARIF